MPAKRRSEAAPTERAKRSRIEDSTDSEVELEVLDQSPQTNVELVRSESDEEAGDQSQVDYSQVNQSQMADLEQYGVNEYLPGRSEYSFHSHLL